MQVNKINRKTLFLVSAAVISIAFFIGTVLVDGPVWCVDSESYTSMDISREPLYPLFLMLLRAIFINIPDLYGQASYLFAAAFLQSIIWAFAAYAASKTIYEMVFPHKGERIAGAFGYLALACQFIAPVLNRFIVNRRSMYSECIMTESLAMPVYVLFILSLYKYETTGKKKYYVLLIIETFIAISLRKQLLIVMIIWFAVDFFIKRLYRKKNLLRLITLITTLILIFAANIVFDRTYNYALRGYFTEHVGNSQGRLCTLLYSAEEEDAAFFDEDSERFPGIKDLYLKIYGECSERGILLESTADDIGIMELTSHFADSYDIIGYEVMMPICFDYVKQLHPDYDDVMIRLEENELERELANRLMKEDKADLIRVYLSNLVRAFVYSNASIFPAALVYVSFAVYGLFVFLLLYNVKLLRKGSDLENSFISKALTFSAITIIGLVVNAGIVAMVIFPQGRYMSYGMGLFYTGIMILLPF